MSAIRPLATIAMLMVLGYFLWTRINTPDLEQTSENELALEEGMPALDLDFGAEGGTLSEPPPAFSASPAPGYEPTDTPAPSPEAEAAPNPEFNFGPTGTGDTASIVPLESGDVSAMPELPDLPNDVPTANFGNAPVDPPADSVAVPETAEMADTSALPPLDVAGLPPIGTETMPTIDTPTAPLNDTVAGMAAAEAASLTSAFATAKPAIDAALARGELQQAHLLLSQWYGDRSLTAGEREQVDNLLGQLAGTVIYSKEHRLESPHRVQPGETLETISQNYNVPWQLLAKINGVAQPTAVIPGQELKVLRGPFSAVVDVERQQLALVLVDRYAGKFNVKTEGQAALEGAWIVTQKQMPGMGAGDTKRVLLEPAGGANGSQLVLGPPSDTSPPTAGAIRVAPRDQDDLFDILSIGSRVMIRK